MMSMPVWTKNHHASVEISFVFLFLFIYFVCLVVCWSATWVPRVFSYRCIHRCMYIFGHNKLIVRFSLPTASILLPLPRFFYWRFLVSTSTAPMFQFFIKNLMVCRSASSVPLKSTLNMQIAHIRQQITYFRSNYQHKIVRSTTINIRYCSMCTGSLLQMCFVITCVRSDKQSISTFIFESR